MTVSSLIKDFLEYLELEGNSQATIRNYDHYLKRFLDFARLAKRAGDIDPKDIDLSLTQNYRLYLARWSGPQTKKGLKCVTQNFFLIALRSFLKYLTRQDIKTLSPEKVLLFEQEPSPLKVLNDKQLKQLLDAPDTSKKDGIRDRALLEALFSTGLRVSELASLNCDSINLNRREFGIIGKGGKERIVFLSDCAVDWLEKYLNFRKDSFKPLFIRFQGRLDPENSGEAMRLTPRSIQRIVEKYVRELGLPVKATPHSLRQRFAADLLIKGADIRRVAQILGHSNISTTKNMATLSQNSSSSVY